MDTQKNKKMAKFIGFLKAVNIFVPEPIPVLSEIELEKIAIDAKIAKIIDTGNLSSITLLIEQNVNFSDSNMSKILCEGDIHQKIFKLDTNIRSKFLDDYKAQITKILINTILNFDSLLDYPDKIQGSYGIHANYKPDYEKFRSASTIIYILGTRILKDDPVNIALLYEKAHEIKNKIEKLNTDTRRGITDDIAKKYIIEPLATLYSTSNREELIQLANRSRILELADINTIMADDVNKKIHTFNPGSLPKEAQNLFNEIKAICQDLQGHKKQLDTAQSLHFDNLYLKRLPNVIQEYITIPERYRKQLKANKDNPDNLLTDSLSEIKNNLHDMMMQLQEKNLNKMKVSNLYLKNI